jgi:hypothetical protein
MDNPYKAREDTCFWSRSVAAIAPGQIDPVIQPCIISPDEKIATMGSCFAQHLARHIQMTGCHYYVAETTPSNMSEAEAKSKNYGVFSARYGNVYTVRQALQLFDRAFGHFRPIDDVWQRQTRFVDAFRPAIEPDGYESREAVQLATTQHLHHVRDVFTQTNWLVLTLGLTEAWRHKQDGAIYPLAPGVVAGEFNPELYEFVNFTVEEVQADLALFITKIRQVNPAIKLLLTVSPVPLIATYQRRHVLVANTLSKAVLRVAADMAERCFNNVIYFPAYEIITAPATLGRYYADDLRQVTEIGVRHVMRVFQQHFLSTQTQQPPVANYAPHQLVCDEETITQALRISGF